MTMIVCGESSSKPNMGNGGGLEHPRGERAFWSKLMANH